MGSFSRQALGKQYDGFSDELMAQLFPNGLEDRDISRRAYATDYTTPNLPPRSDILEYLQPTPSLRDMELGNIEGTNGLRFDHLQGGPDSFQLQPLATAPKERVIMGQPHALAYINPEEERMLMEEGGQGTMTKEGIPAYWTATEPSTWGDGNGYEGIGDFNASNNTTGGAAGVGTNRGGRGSEVESGSNNHPDAGNSSDNDGNNDYEKRLIAARAAQAAKQTAAQAEAAKRSSALSGLTGKYNAYNDSVNTFNQNFDDYQTMFDENSGTINNATIANIYDDPDTEENENYFDNYNTMFRDAASDLNSFSLAAPSLSSGGYTFGASELPTLAEVSDYSALASNFSGLSDTLSGLQTGRANEVTRIGDLASSLQGDLGAVGYDISNLQNTDGTYDLSQAGSTSNVDRLLYNLGQERGGFSSLISDQIDDPFTSFDTNYQDASGTLSGFNAAVDDERSRIDTYNQGLFDYADTLLGDDSLGGYDITSGSALDTLKRQIDGKQRQAGRFDSELGFDFGDSLTEVQGLEDQLDTLIAERDTEQAKIDNYRTSIDDTAFDYGQSAAGLGIADIDKINTLNKQIAALKTQAGRFKNPLSFDFSDVTGEGSALASVEGSLSGLLADRETEQSRIDEEGTRLGGLYSGYNTLFGGDAENDVAGLNISNIDQLNELRRNIDAAQLGASRFDSELSTDDAFRYPLEDLSSLEGNVDQMLIDRRDELSRIDNAQTNFGNAADAAERSAASGNYYSKAALDAIQERITSGQRDISEFDSLLDYNFGAAGSDGTAVQDYLDSQVLLDDLVSKRGSAIDDIEGGITGSIADLDSTELYNEDAMLDMLSDLTGRGNDLAYYSGGRVGDLTKNISTNKGLVNDRLDDLYGQRDQYEADALEMLTSLGDSDYGRTNYDEYAGLIEPLRDNIDLYGATQASDELRGLDTELARRLGLVEADEAAVQSRQALESQNADFTGDYALTDPLTEAGYYNLYNEEEEEELDEFGNPISAFSTNVRAA